MGAAVQVLNNPSSLGSGAKLCNFHTFHSHIVVKWFCVKASYKYHASCFFSEVPGGIERTQGAWLRPGALRLTCDCDCGGQRRGLDSLGHCQVGEQRPRG